MLVFTAECPFKDLGNGIASRQGRMSDNSRASEVKFETGAFGQLHKLPAPQQVRVLSGEFEFTLGNDMHILFAGETLSIPAATLFGCFCLAEGSLLEIPQK
ncbi:cupin [Serratia aquatilis]|uniref:Cupin n=1 Tax=Serratia aquatilis TaxID=1737515 RepID=A0ABV6EDZ3_9GAMM